MAGDKFLPSNDIVKLSKFEDLIISFMYTLNETGSIVLPYGTPQFNPSNLDQTPSRTT